MADIVEQLAAIVAEPSDEDAFKAWIEQRDALGFMKANAEADELVIYASFRHAFIHAVAIPADRLERPDADDLLEWNCNAYSSWGIDYDPREPEQATIGLPLSDTGSKTLDGGTKLIFPRSFEGLVGETHYFEVLQELAHVFELHFVPERRAYSRLDERGDVEDFIRIVSVEGPDGDIGTAIVFRRSLLDEWMLLTGTCIVQMFDFTRFRLSAFSGWSDNLAPDRAVAGDLIYRAVIQSGYASYTRGVQIVRPAVTQEVAFRRLDWTRRKEREYASFIAHDFKNNVIREISSAPGETANYFTQSDLPFETSPAFFRPEVLQKYKADSDKYRLEDRSIQCRGAWHLETFDINEAGQVHTYICYLRNLPYEEQLYWKAYNEEPKAPISKRALTTDFKGEWDTDYDALQSLKSALRDWRDRHVPWWKLRSDKLLDQVHYPFTSSADEWANELLLLDQLVVEGFDGKWLRKRAHALARNPEPQFMSLKLIEECLIGLGFEERDARSVTAPLHRLHELRSKMKGHAAGGDSVTLKREALTKHKTYRKHFEALCTESDEAVRTINKAFKDFSR